MPKKMLFEVLVVLERPLRAVLGLFSAVFWRIWLGFYRIWLYLPADPVYQLVLVLLFWLLVLVVGAGVLVMLEV